MALIMRKMANRDIGKGLKIVQGTRLSRTRLFLSTIARKALGLSPLGYSTPTYNAPIIGGKHSTKIRVSPF